MRAESREPCRARGWRQSRRRPRGTSAGRRFAACALLVLAGLAQAGDPARSASASTWLACEDARELPLGLDVDPREYSERQHVDANTVALGRVLFFDPRLSQSGRTSCATCHQPEHGFTDGRALAIGDAGTVGRRNTPTIVNRAFGRAQFLDGRAASLEQQALGPLLSPAEMGMTSALFAARFEQDVEFTHAFDAAFGRGPTLELAARALAAFEATLASGNSPYDRFEWLGDVNALSADALAGLRLFRGRARCTKCHAGPNLSDEAFHDVGAGLETRAADLGRELASGLRADRGKFKTPTLRNVARTAPYMHDGSLATLADVVAFYADGGRPDTNRDPELRELELTTVERAQLVAFLESLTGDIVLLSPALFRDETPASPSAELDRR